MIRFVLRTACTAATLVLALALPGAAQDATRSVAVRATRGATAVVPTGSVDALLAADSLLATAADSTAAPAFPETLAAQVRTEVSDRWQVADTLLELAVGEVPGGEPLDAESALELLGAGTGGHWIARVTTPNGDVVSVHVRTGVRTPVRVAARALSRGQILSEMDIDTSSEVRWGPPLPPEPEVAEGWEVRRMVRPGEPLREPVVGPPLAVRSGRPVDVVWERGGVGIRLKGRAMGSAPVGGEVFVRTESGERLRGVVRAQGVVDVTRGGSDG